MASDREAVMVFQRFMGLLHEKAGNPLFNETIYYIPGNHDHHLWETARENRYAKDVRSKELYADLPNVRHVTKLFVGRGENSIGHKPYAIPLLEGLARKHPHLKEVEICAFYPNLGLIDKERRKCIVFHHGHFTEALYSMISQIQPWVFNDRSIPETVNFIEADNFAWIDFIWSTIGRSGDAGRDIETLFDVAQIKHGLDMPIKTLSRKIAEHLGSRRTDFAEWRVINLFLEHAIENQIKGLEKNVYHEALTPESVESLKSYVSGVNYFYRPCCLTGKCYHRIESFRSNSGSMNTELLILATVP